MEDIQKGINQTQRMLMLLIIRWDPCWIGQLELNEYYHHANWVKQNIGPFKMTVIKLVDTLQVEPDDNIVLDLACGM
jgi:hypothetical protein